MSPSILFAIEHFHPRGGGAESYLVELAASFAQQGWEVHVAAERWDRSITWATFHPIPLPHHLPNWVRGWLFARRHRTLVRRHPFDLVYGVGNTLVMDLYQSHGGVHWYTAMRKTYAVANPLLRCAKQLATLLSPKHHLRHYLEAAAFRQGRPVPVVAISDLVRDDLCRWFHLDPTTLHLVYNGIDPHRFQPEILAATRPQARQRFGLAAGETCFAFVSYELEKKGMVPLLEACGGLAAQGRDFRLLVAGGRPSARLRRRARRAGMEKRVIWAGPVADVATVYSAADAVVLPTYYDACSLATLEAMHCGLPVLTTASNGASGVIDHGENGLVASAPPRAGELQELLGRLLDPGEREKLGAAARRRVAPLTKEANHRAILELAAAVAAGKGTTTRR